MVNVAALVVRAAVEPALVIESKSSPARFGNGRLTTENGDVAAWEIVLEPDVEDGDPTGNFEFTVRVPGGIDTKVVTVPADYLASLPSDTPVKIEVGAIGVNDNATFTEVGGFCVNEHEGCE